MVAANCYNPIFDSWEPKEEPQPIENTGVVALPVNILKYSNVLSSFTFFLDFFHFSFGY